MPEGKSLDTASKPNKAIGSATKMAGKSNPALGALSSIKDNKDLLTNPTKRKRLIWGGLACGGCCLAPFLIGLVLGIATITTLCTQYNKIRPYVTALAPGITAATNIAGSDMAQNLYNKLPEWVRKISPFTIFMQFAKNKDFFDKICGSSSIPGSGIYCNVDCVVNGHEVAEPACGWLNYVAHNVTPRLEGSPEEQLNTAAVVSWWSLKEGVMSLQNPIAYSNCSTGKGDKHIGPLEVCSGPAWQVGLSAVQVPDHSLESVEATAAQLFPDQTTDQLLEQTAREAGLSESDVEQVVKSTGNLRKSWLLRVSAIGFTHEAETVISQCINDSRSWCFGSGWGSSSLYAPNRAGAMQAIEDIKKILTAASSSNNTDCIEGGTTDPGILQAIINKMKQSSVVSGLVGHWSDIFLTKLQVPYWNGSEIKTMTIATNKLIAGSVQQIFQELANIHFRIIPGETHSWRTGQGAGATSAPSAHLFGLAIDINPSLNPYCRNCARPAGSNERGTITDEVVAIFARHGFQWGGNWHSVKDYMHFSVNLGNLSGMLQ